MQTVQLGLVPAERDLTAQERGRATPRVHRPRKSTVSYLDFTANEQRVLDYLTDAIGAPLDNVGVLQEAWPIPTVVALERLLGAAPADLGNGGVSPYVCPECGGLGCGTIAARLDIDEDTITWRAIGMQYDDTEEIFPLGTTGHFPNLTFERRSYEEVLQRELDRIRPMLEEFEHSDQRPRRERHERRRVGLLRILGWR